MTSPPGVIGNPLADENSTEIEPGRICVDLIFACQHTDAKLAGGFLRFFFKHRHVLEIVFVTAPKTKAGWWLHPL